MTPHLGYVLMGFPRVSETFIASEIARVEQAGVPVRLFVIKPVEAREHGPAPSRRRRDRGPPVLPARPALADRAAAPLAARRTCARSRRRSGAPPARRPAGLARAVALALGQALRDRRAPLAGPRKIYVKELIQAIALADRLLAAPEVRHLHAHFAHGTTTVTWLAATITGLPFSFTGHARDIYARDLNPRGWLRRKLLAAEFAVTCTAANVAHLRADRARGRRPPRLPRAQRGLRAAARRRRSRTGARTARCACSASGASSPRRASTCWSTRAPCSSAAASRSRR